MRRVQHARLHHALAAQGRRLGQQWNERNLGHATSTDLRNWTVQARNVLQVPGTWDTHHVWAPHVVRKANDITYYMFYTGVDDNENQKIGVATSTDLVSWTRRATPILAATNIPWVDPNPPDPYFGQQQFRDPFVMEDPTTPGQWLMYFTAVAKDRTPGMFRSQRREPSQHRHDELGAARRRHEPLRTPLQRDSGV